LPIKKNIVLEIEIVEPDEEFAKILGEHRIIVRKIADIR
jgi:hypothetical protein